MAQPCVRIRADGLLLRRFAGIVVLNDRPMNSENFSSAAWIFTLVACFTLEAKGGYS